MKRIRIAIACGPSLAAATAHVADSFAPLAAQATLSVEYTCESAGKEQDTCDLHEWNVSRAARTVADLAAQAPQPRNSVGPAGEDGAATTGESWTLPLKGGWRGLSGERVVMLAGDAGDGGELTVRWRHAAQ